MEPGPFGAAFGEDPHDCRSLVSEEEFKLAELGRLEAAGRIEAGPEGQELQRRHRFEHLDLGDEGAEDNEDAAQCVQGGAGVGGAQSGDEVVEFVEDDFEPQFVHLVGDDEEQFVVLWSG